MTTPYIDPNLIFAENAPVQDKPAAFQNYDKGWDASRTNDGRPLIPQMNYLTQQADLKNLYIHENGAALPYKDGIAYEENAVVVKDGVLQQWKGGEWLALNSAGQIVDSSGKTQQEINNLINYVTYKTPRQFGGKPNDPAFDNRYALQAAMDSDEPIFLDGLYYTTQAPVITKLKTIVGAHQETTGIVKIGNALSGLSSVAIDADPSHNDIYDVDAILIVRGGAYNSGLDNLYVQGLDFKNFRLDRHNYVKPLNNDNSFGFYAPRLGRSSFESFYVDNKNFGTGVRSFNIWMCKWSRCESKAHDTWHFGASRDQPYPYNAAGTSNMMLDCWARVPGGFAYLFIGLQYSTVINLACDYGGTASTPMDYVYYVSGTANMTFINCAAEHIHGRLIWVSPNSRAVFIDPDFNVGIHGRKDNAGALILINNSKFKMINGRINLAADSASAYIQVLGTSQASIENLQTNVQITNIERANSYSLTTSDKSKIYINGGYVEFKDGANTIEHDYATNKTKRETATLTTQEKDQSTTGSIKLTREDSRLQLINYNACQYTHPVRFGRSRIWSATPNNHSALYLRQDSDPSSETDGILLNSLRGVGATLSWDKIQGQHFLRTTDNKPWWWTGTAWVDALGIASNAKKPSITGLNTPTTFAEQKVVNDSIVAALVELGLVIDSRT